MTVKAPDDLVAQHQPDAGPHGALPLPFLAMLLAICLASVLILGTLYYGPTLEDAFITYRYSEHLAEGHGIGAWNKRGEPVEGYSTIAWMLILAVCHAMGMNVVTASKVLGIVLHLLLPATFIGYAALQSEHEPTTPLTRPRVLTGAGFLLATYLPLAWYATTGMESLLFIWLLALGFLSAATPGGRQKWILSASCGLLVLVRPEGILLAGAMIVYGMSVRKSVREFYPAAATVIGATLLVIVYRLTTFGDLLPNTYWAKAAGASSLHMVWGLQYVAGWARSNATLLLFLLIAACNLSLESARSSGARLRALAPSLVVFGTVAVYTVYIIKVGGDNHSAFPFWRHFIHICPLMLLLAAYAVTCVRPGRRWFHMTLVVVLSLILNASLLYTHGARLIDDAIPVLSGRRLYAHDPHNSYYLWLADLTTGDTVVSSSLGGELPYVVDAVHIDALGLSTPHIARHGRFDPAGPQDSKTDMAWVLAQSPDIIEGYVSGTMIANGAPLERILDDERPRMNHELLRAREFQENYLFVVNGPYTHLDRALFVHREWWADHPRGDEIEVVPVSATTLGDAMR